MPGFRIPFWPKPSSDRRAPRYLWRSFGACAIGLALSLAAALATGQRELQLAQTELNGLANGYALTLAENRDGAVCFALARISG